jgi:quinol monooxygenase YgiN
MGRYCLKGYLSGKRMNDDIVLNVHLTAAPGQEQTLEQQLRALVEPSRAEPGCISYELHRDPENPGKFMFQERFRGQAALDAHLATPHFRQFVAFRAANQPDPVESAVVTRWKVIG